MCEVNSVCFTACLLECIANVKRFALYSYWIQFIFAYALSKKVVKHGLLSLFLNSHSVGAGKTIVNASLYSHTLQ